MSRDFDVVAIGGYGDAGGNGRIKQNIFFFYPLNHRLNTV